MKAWMNRILVLGLSLMVFFSGGILSAFAEDVAIEQPTTTKTLYRYREKVETTSRLPLEEPWTLVSQTSSTQLLREHDRLDPNELAEMESRYSSDAYYISKTPDGIICKFSTRPNGGSVYYYEESFLEGPLYQYDTTQYTCYRHPTTGLILYYRDVCTTYKLSVYTRYEYRYWKWAEWSAWSEEPCEASETMEVETKESDLLYRFREKQYTTSQTKLDDPWILYDTTKTPYTLYHYYKWGEWSGWSYTPIEASDKTEVETKVAPVFTVSYDANGGICAPGSTIKRFNENAMLSTDIPTRENHQFLGWSTLPQGEAEYAAGGVYSANENITLYAVWKNVTKYTVSYDANGGEGVPEMQTKTHGIPLILSEAEPARTGYVFCGWTTGSANAAVYLPGASYEVDENVTLRAVWEKKTYTVSYNANGGTGAPSSQEKVHGEALTLSGVEPVRAGYTFRGWATSAGGTVVYASGASYETDEDVTLYAVWRSRGKIVAYGFCGADGNNLTWVLNESGELYVGGVGAMANYTYNNGRTNAPWQAQGIGVSVKTVTVEPGVTSIGNYAFFARSVTSVTIPDSVTAIGDAAFEYCHELISVTIPDSVTTIGSFAFYGCDGLTSVTIGDGVTSIGSAAFYNCDGLTSVVIPDSVTTIGNSAFEDCDGLTSMVIPNSVTSIAYKTFCDCDGLTSVVIPDSVTTIGSSAFYDCDGLTSMVIPYGVTSIDYKTFYDCDALTSVTIPDSVTSIGNGAFEDCDGLTMVTIGDSVTTIGDYAFRDCDELDSVVIPASVASIGDYAFHNCDWLWSVYYLGDANGWGNISIGSSNSALTEATRHYITALTDIVTITVDVCENGVISAPTITAKRGWMTVAVTPAVGYKLDKVYVNGVAQEGLGFIVPDVQSVTITAKFVAVRPGETAVIGGSCGSKTYWALYESSELVIYGSGAVTDYSYSSNSAGTDVPWWSQLGSVKKVAIETGVTRIGDYAFYGCAGLTSVTIPDSVITIGICAFENCAGLTSVVIPDSVTTIGSSAFYDCAGLTSVIIPDSVTSIGSYAFSGCAGLTSVVIPDCVTRIGNYAFRGCHGLTSVTIPDSVTRIGSYAFEDCDALTSVTIPDSVTSIGDYALHDCDGLTSVTIPDSVTSIGRYAFAYCDALTSVVIPDSVTAIGNGVFCNSNNLAHVYYLGDANGWRNISIGSSNSALTEATRHYITALTDIVTITVDVCENGVISAPTMTAKGERIAIIVTPAAGYKLGALYVNGVAQEELTFTVPDVQTVDITAEFAAMRPGEVAVMGGSCGSKTYWALYESGELVICGGGAMTNYSYSNSGASTDAPWWSQRGSVKRVTVETGVTSVGNHAFRDCDDLTSVDIPDSVITIGSYAFFGCADLTSVDIPDSVITIGSYAFFGCAGLTSVTIGDGMISIEKGAFYGCDRLTEIVISDSVTSIGNDAFYSCSALTSVTIPDSVTSIGEDVFQNCYKLAVAVYCGTREQWEQVSVGSGNEKLAGILHCGIPVSLTVQGVQEAYPAGTASVKPAAVTLTLSTGETIDVTEIADVTCDLAAVGQGKVTVSWGTLTTVVLVTVYSGAHAILEVADVHNAQLKLYAQKAGCAIVAFYERIGGQMLAAQRFDMPVGNSQTTLTEQNIDLTTVDCKIILLDGDGKPMCKAIGP